MLIDPVYFKVAAVLLLNQPSEQWPWQRYVGAGTGDKPTDVPCPSDVAQRFRICGTEEQVSQRREFLQDLHHGSHAMASWANRWCLHAAGSIDYQGPDLQRGPPR